jgi:hypothetical protein
VNKTLPAKFYHILETIGSLMFLGGTTLTFIGIFNIQVSPKLSLSLMGFGVIAVLVGAYNLKSKSLLANIITNQKT